MVLRVAFCYFGATLSTTLAIQGHATGRFPGNRSQKAQQMNRSRYFRSALLPIAARLDEEIPPDLGGKGLDHPPEPGKPYAAFPTKEALEARLDRASRAELKRLFGTDNTDTILARWAKIDEMERAEEERKRAEMSEIDRLKLEKQQEADRAKSLADQLEQEKLERHIATQCAAKGIKATGYASYLILRASEALPDGEQLDVGKFLDEQLKDGKTKAALDLQEPRTERVPAPVSTNVDPETPAPPPPPPGHTPPAKDAMDMTPEEFRKHKESLGLL